MTEQHALLLQLLVPGMPVGGAHLRKEDLETMKIWARRRGLLMLLYARLTECNRQWRDATVEEFLAQMRPLFKVHAGRVIRQETTGQDVVELLGNRRIDACVFKGIEIAREVYRDEYCRASADIDLLVRARDVSSADEVLVAAGYVREEKTPLAFWLSRLHHAAYRHAATGVLLELHWNFSIPSFFRLSSEEIWEGVIFRSGKWTLDPETMLLMLLMHHFMHAFRELRILIDIVWAFHRYAGDISWERFTARLARVGLSKTTLLTLSQVHALWGKDSGAAPAAVTIEEHLRRAGHRLPRLFASYFELDPGREYVFQNGKDKVMMRMAIDTGSGIFNSFVKSLIPLPGEIRALYAADRNSALLPGYLRFMAWRMRAWLR